MRTSEQIYAEIEKKLGKVPDFYRVAVERPRVLENLWQQSLAYLESAIETSFKTKAYVALSRHRRGKYWLLVHSCTLFEMGVPAAKVFAIADGSAFASSTIDSIQQGLEQLPPVEGKWPALMRTIVLRTLRQAGFTGHEYLEADNGANGYKTIMEAKPDLVLSDWNMPEMTGIELLQKLRDEGNKVPFGFVTSEGTPDMRARAATAGALFLIAKPFTAEMFQAELADIVT